MEPVEQTWEVLGQPVPQPRPRFTRAGIAYTPAGHPIKKYREQIRLTAKNNGWPDGSTDGPYAVEIDWFFARPPSHLTAAGKVKKNARQFPSRADVDNLSKAVLDAITDSQAIWRDDDQVVRLWVFKTYAEPGMPPRTLVTIRRL